MDHTYIEENQIADRYVQGTLPADEAERFENHYLSCPECLDQLGLAESMQRGFHRAAAQDVGKLVAVQQLAVLVWLARLSRRSQAGVLLSAFLVLAILPASLGLQTVRRGRELDATRAALASERAARERTVPQLAHLQQPEANFPVLHLDKERGVEAPGEGPTQRLIQPREGPIVLVPQIDPPFQPSYSVRLLAGKDREIYSRQGLYATEDGSLTLSLPSSLLPPGDYTLAVDGIAAGVKPANAGRFTFRVIR
jgi:hypothetical protein